MRIYFQRATAHEFASIKDREICKILKSQLYHSFASQIEKRADNCEFCFQRVKALELAAAIKGSVLQCVAGCCSVLQCVAECCSVLQCVTGCCRVLHRMLQCVPVCCRVLLCVAVCYKVLQCILMCDTYFPSEALSCSVLQCVAECSSVLQCVAVCCSVL